METTLKSENKEYIPKEWEEVCCLFCGETQTRPHEKFGPKDRYHYVQCLNCSLVYLNPRPKYDEEFLSIAYSRYGSDNHHVLHNGNLDESERVTVEAYKVSLRQMERVLGRKGKILDIGCATGLFLLAAQEEGWDGVGIDISKSMVDFMKETFGFPGFAGQYNETNLSEYAPFDVIYCSHVIEHIPNPVEWMEKFKRELKTDGLVCLNIPNQYSADRVVKRFLKTVGLRREKWQLWRTPDHLYEPHEKSMAYLIRKTGFKKVKSITYPRRERERGGFLYRLYHFVLQWGSKMRLFLRPV